MSILSKSINEGSKAILVLGMHRSGTSALTGILHILGVALGADLMPPDEDNLHGYWEDAVLVEMNERILDLLNARWDDLLLGNGAWWERPELGPVKQLIRERLERGFSSASLWAFKDPRMCRLLPAWREVFEPLSLQPLCIHMLRHPVEVARSLERRDGLSRVQAVWLWLLHVLEAERHSRGMPRVFVTYADLLADWLPVVEAIGRGLGIGWPLEPTNRVEAVEGFLSGELRHHRSEQAEEGASPSARYWLQRAEEVYAFLGTHGQGEVSDALLLRELGDELEELFSAPRRQLSDATSRLWACRRRLQPLEAAQARLEARLASSQWTGWSLPATGCTQSSPSGVLPESSLGGEGAVVVEQDKVLDVIIPVFGGVRETRECLEALFDSGSDGRIRVIVVDDASPYPELATWLDELAAEGRIHLLRHEHNQGFAAAVNTGMMESEERDVLLLNSDAIVPKGWLERLLAAAYRGAFIGTVTPFSNNASICSYPQMLEDNPLSQGWTLEALDACFRRANSGAIEEIPTAVGFCMLITRACLKDVGFFDTTAFRSGYGEEDEFCMRARRRGWRHVIATDIFVYHKGAVSFADAGRLQREARERLDQIHPEYAELTQAFIQADPLRPYRYRVDLLRAEAKHEEALALLGARHQELAECRGDLDALAQRYRDLDEYARAVARERDAYAPQLDILAVELERLRAEVRALEAAREKALQLFSSQLAAVSDERDAYGERLQEVGGELGRLREQIIRLERELETVYSSRSWRYTAPLRRWLGP